MPGADILTLAPSKQSNGPVNPLNLNRYSYGLNNPVKHTDPTGHCIEDLCIGEAIVVTAIATAAEPEIEEGLEAVTPVLEAGIEKVGEVLAQAGDALASQEQRLTEGLVYRGGSATMSNLTPRATDTTGLSTFNTLEQATEPGGKAQVIDIGKLTHLVAHFDNEPPGHVSLRPKDLGEIADWAATRVGTIAHRYTQDIMDAIISVAKRPK